MRSFAILLCMVALVTIPCNALASPVLLEAPATISFPTAGSTDTLVINFTGGEVGLSGYNLSLSVTPPGIVEVASVVYPPWAGMVSNGTMPAENTWIQAVDLQMQVEPGDSPVLLATITLQSIADGESVLTVTPLIVDDDRGGRHTLEPLRIPVRVGVVPVETNSPDANRTKWGASSSSVEPSVVPDSGISPSVSPISRTEESTTATMQPVSSPSPEDPANESAAFPPQSAPGFGVATLCLTGLALGVLGLKKLNRGR